MRIAIMGTGGVGAVFGARLAHAGADVTFVARGKHKEAIVADGLQIKSAERGDLLIKPCRVVSAFEQEPPFDFIFVTVKLWDTETAIETIRPVVGENTTVISFQNGISRDELLQAAFGAHRVMGGISYVGATISAPGLIEQKGTVQKLVFGEYDGTISPRALSLKAALEKADIEAVVVTDILSSLWQKFVVLVAMSSLTASVRQPIGPVRANAKTRELLQRVMEEVVAVATASGVNLPADLVSDRMAYLDGLAPDVTASMEYDLRVGNRLELPWLAGTVVALGKKLAVATPVSSTLCAILDPYVNGRS